MRYGLLNDIRILDKKKYPLLIAQYAALGEDKNTILPKQLPWPALETIPITNPDIKEKIESKRKTLALCPGAEYGPAKRWPEKYFASVAKQKYQEGWNIWLMGGPNDKEITTKIAELAEVPCQNFAGQTTILEAVDLLALAQAVVTNDSGLMHIACAVRCPKIVVIYGSSTPQYTPPLSVNAEIITAHTACSPCFKRECPRGHLKCMHDIKPEHVLSALS
jgi:heptosyltransferase-2